MRASVYITEDQATPAELADHEAYLVWANTPNNIRSLKPAPARTPGAGTIQPDGSYRGAVYVSGPYVDSGEGPDYRTATHAALEALMDQDPRVAAGHFFKIAITA